MTERLTLSLPDDVAEDLRYLSTRMSISRSALVSRLLADPLSDLRALTMQVPEQPDEETIRRLRGQSETIINQRLAELNGIIWD